MAFKKQKNSATNRRDPNYKDPQKDKNHRIFANGIEVTNTPMKKVFVDLSKEDLAKLITG